MGPDRGRTMSERAVAVLLLFLRPLSGGPARPLSGGPARPTSLLRLYYDLLRPYYGLTMAWLGPYYDLLRPCNGLTTTFLTTTLL